MSPLYNLTLFVEREVCLYLYISVLITREILGDVQIIHEKNKIGKLQVSCPLIYAASSIS